MGSGFGWRFGSGAGFGFHYWGRVRVQSRWFGFEFVMVDGRDCLREITTVI